jgi:uncharacterized protein (TIGR02996 family)
MTAIEPATKPDPNPFVTMLRESNGANIDAWLVYGDWLEERGDPFAQQIRAKLRITEEPIEVNDQMQRTERARWGAYIITRRTHSPHATGPDRPWIVACIERVGARFGAKPHANYRFNTEEKREEFIKRWQREHLERAARRLWQTVADRLARAEFVNPYHVGDLLYHSWGYDETHIDFAQIVKVGPRSATVRRIAARTLRAVGWCHTVVAPDRDHFLSEHKPKTVTVQVKEYQGKVSHYLPGWSPCGEREEFHDTSGSR